MKSTRSTNENEIYLWVWNGFWILARRYSLPSKVIKNAETKISTAGNTSILFEVELWSRAWFEVSNIAWSGLQYCPRTSSYTSLSITRNHFTRLASFYSLIFAQASLSDEALEKEKKFEMLVLLNSRTFQVRGLWVKFCFFLGCVYIFWWVHKVLANIENKYREINQ